MQPCDIFDDQISAKRNYGKTRKSDQKRRGVVAHWSEQKLL